jgi:hypothetical protein
MRLINFNLGLVIRLFNFIPLMSALFIFFAGSLNKKKGNFRKNHEVS